MTEAYVTQDAGDRTATEAPPPTGTVTFLLSDIEDSTPAWDAHPDLMSTAVTRHYAILDQAVHSHGGVRPVEQGEGDSMVAAFAHATDALGAALAAQRMLLAEPWAEQAPIRVRMALHAGEARIRDQLYYAGPSIIRCARLRSLAHGGQVLVSAAIADLLADGLPDGTTLHSLGTHRLKGLRVAEEVFQLGHPDLPDRFPPLESPTDRPTVPTSLTSFVGRLTEVVELIELTTRHRLLSLVGTGGCGKTRLALEVAGEVCDSFADGTWWVELAEVSEADSVPNAVMTAVGLDARGCDPLERLTGYLGSRRALLILDNCEHVTEAAAAVIQAVLARCPAVTVLATSREPLGVTGEQTWRVEPLSVPREVIDGTEDLAEVRGAEAVQLFAERAGAVRAGFRVDATTAHVVAAICRRVDGVPLAVELAAARVGSLPPERILAGLEQRFRLLASHSRGLPARQQTLEASVEWSHDLLDAPERVLLRRLAVFVGPFSLDAAEAVAADATLDRWDVLSALSALVEKSLVSFDGERYLLLQTVRDFATQRLVEAGEADTLRDAHLAHYVSLAAQAAAALSDGPQIATLNSLEDARANLLTAADWALARGDHAAACSVVTDLALFWQLHGRHSESLACMRRVLAAMPDERTPARARLLWALGQLGLYGMDLPGGYGMTETAGAIDLATQLGCPDVLGRALGVRGFITSMAAPQLALDTIAEAHAAATTAQDPYGIAASAAYGAWTAVFACDQADLAAPWLAMVADCAAQTGSPLWHAWHNFVVGMGHWHAGRLSEAVAALRIGDDTWWELGDPVLESWCAVMLADALIDSGAYETAERVINRSAAWMDKSSYGRCDYILSRRPVLELARGNLAAVRVALDPAETAFATMGFDFVSLQLAVLRARHSLADGDVEGAGDAVAVANELAARLGMPWYCTAAANVAGRLARAQDRPAEAEDAHHRALALCVRHGYTGVAAETLEHLASLALAGGNWTEAARLFGAAEALRQQTGQVRGRLDEAAVQDDQARLIAELGEETWTALREEGAGQDLAAAAGYAARCRGERKRPAAGWESLTPMELTVVELAARGLTNAQIGEKLFITAGTAKVHLHHVFGKLGVSRRAELATLATERRLTGEPSI